ncbi:hypothetical protein RhiirA5_495028 [Rhizophagus irregularis]|uniref:Uncharacterized protein n=1 Tax=Rhizophagus irregularis TaxID=588596 RepID=A0A2N0Q719_9GLOM|nr:hypothetical protein RhiirA5_495028 [Rhizophagus irregularis]
MSSKNYGSRTCGKPYVQKIKLNNNKRTRRKPSKLCSDCEETNDYIKLLSSKVSRIEKIVDNFKNLPKNKTENKLSVFNAKFSLNNVPCEMEYDLSNFTLENLQKLVIFTTQNCKPKN